MSGSSKNWIINLVVSLVAGIGSVYLLRLIPFLINHSVLTGTVVFFVLMSIFYARHTRRKVAQSTCPIYDRRERICRLGIKGVHQKAEYSIAACLDDVKQGETYRWLGFSAVNVTCRREGEEAITGNPKRAREYEFCTLSPEAHSVLDSQAAWQQRDLGLVTNNLHTSSVAMDNFKRRMGLNVSNPTHYFPPTFRLVIVGDRKTHVGFYIPGQSGIDSPEVELVRTDSDACLFRWFQWYYIKTKQDGETCRLDRMVLKARFEDPKAGPDEIARTVAAQGVEVAEEEVRHILEEYEVA